MAAGSSQPEYLRSIRRLVFAITCAVLCGIFLIWRIDNVRVEQLRANVIDQVAPGFEWTLRPVALVGRMLADVRAYTRVYQQNEELRRELQRMQGWREAALQLEQRNARLLALNNVRLSPRMSYVTAEVLADAGSPFRRSALINVGYEDAVEDGFPVVDGLGLVGRIAGTGRRSSRVIFITDGSSRVPATVQPSGQRVLVSGDNSTMPVIEFVERSDAVRPGDRVVTTGDGGLYPSGILIGRAAMGADRRHRLIPAADHRRLEFVRVVRTSPLPLIEGPGAMIGPEVAGVDSGDSPE